MADETIPAAVVLEAARAPELLTVREFNHLLGTYGVACERSAPTEMKQHGEVVAAYGRALAAAEMFSDAVDELDAKLASVAPPMEDPFVAVTRAQFREWQQLRSDRDTLAAVGRLFLDAVDADPELEMVTLVEAYALTAVRDAVKRWEAENA